MRGRGQRPGEAARARPGAGGAGRGAGRQARRAPPHAPPRRHPHRAAAGEGVRLPRRAAPRQRGLEGGRRRSRRPGAVLDHRGRQPGRQARDAGTLSFENGAALEKAGVLVAFHTDDGITDSRLFLRSAGARRARGHVAREGARGADAERRRACSTWRTASARSSPGKDADFVVLSGDPLSVYTKVLETWVEGVKVFDRERPEGPPVRRGRLRRRARGPRAHGAVRGRGPGDRGTDARASLLPRRRRRRARAAARPTVAVRGETVHTMAGARRSRTAWSSCATARSSASAPPPRSRSRRGCACCGEGRHPRPGRRAHGRRPRRVPQPAPRPGPARALGADPARAARGRRVQRPRSGWSSGCAASASPRSTPATARARSSAARP